MAERVDYTGQTVLGVGFTRKTGLGFVVGTQYAKLGAEVIVGGSSEDSVGNALRNFQRAGVEQSALSPFVADLKDSTQIDRAVASLTKPPSIVVYASALGMEGFFLEMSGYLSEMRAAQDQGEPNAGEIIEQHKSQLREKLGLWLPEGYADALAVNRTAPEYLLDRLTKKFPEPVKFVYVNSTFGHIGAGPMHYRNVYATKRLASEWMTLVAQDMAAQGVDMHEEVDPVIDDTDTGITIIEDIMPFWSEAVQRVVDSTKVSRMDVFGSIRQYTDMTAKQRTERPNPNRHFLISVNGQPVILDKFPEQLMIDAKEFDF